MVPSDSRSYAEQFADLQTETDAVILKTPHPKPSKEAQAKAPGAHKVPFTDNIYVRYEHRPLNIIPSTISKEAAAAKLRWVFLQRYAGFILLHAYVLLVCPFFFTWRNLGIGMLTWTINIIGINFSFHRQLTHRSCKTPKWLEYFAAWCGTLGVQGGPIEWVSRHRYHHLHTDTPLDPHSPYEGFWWSHMRWIYDHKACSDMAYMDYSNATDLTSQAFYRFLEAIWYWQMVARFLITQVFFGTEAVCWTLAWPVVYGWHVTFLVNSAAHLWGYRPYKTGDLSTNNWWVALVAAGEGWHCTHHAFPFSARHGLEWWEVDITYIFIKVLEALGLAWDLQLPTEKQKAAKRTRSTPAAQQKPSKQVADDDDAASETSVGESSAASSTCETASDTVDAQAVLTFRRAKTAT